MAINKATIQALARRIIDPLAGLILRMGFSPDALTLLGLILSIFAGFYVARGSFVAAALLLFLGGLCDILDGSMARRAGRSSKRGAFLDSTLDRLAEIAVFMGLVFLYRERIVLQMVTIMALTGSLMTSYTRARAEGLGVDCKVGMLERPERLGLMILGLLLARFQVAGYGVLELIVFGLAVLTYLTTLQRIIHVVGKTRGVGEAQHVTSAPDVVPPTISLPEDDAADEILQGSVRRS